MSDFWYEHRDDLFPGCVCILEDDSVVRLDRRVPGDGTDWYVNDWSDYSKNWTSEDRRIHPGDIKKGPAFGK